MQVKNLNANALSEGVDNQSIAKSVFENNKTCHSFKMINKASLLKNGSYLTPSKCKRTLIKLNLHKGKIRKSRFRVMFWLYSIAGQLMTTKQKFIYKVIPKE